MLALYRCGRRTQALAVFTALQATLEETLGIEPAPRMQALRDAVLDRDPVLDRPGSVRAGYDGGRGATDATERCS
jgi:DNA-binding SARP family transcriptional activator